MTYPGRTASFFIRRVLAPLVAIAFAFPALAAEQVVVPTRVIYPGEAIDGGLLDIVTLRKGVLRPAGTVGSPAEVEGKVARRTLLPGRPIPAGSVREPYLVEAGTPVRVLFVQGALTISISGVPLQPGAAGDLVKVRNTDSGTVIMGTVMADGTIRVSAI